MTITLYIPLTEWREAGYAFPAPETGAGFGDPNQSKAHQRPYDGAFFTPAIPVMAVRAGNSSELPGTFDLGSPTPRASSPGFGESRGDVNPTLSKETTMSDTLSFAFEGAPVRVVSTDPNHPEFVAADVAKALGFKRPNDAITQHCKGAAKYRTLQTEGGQQKIRVIQEPDLYRLIFGSTLESAKRFQDWVFEEVLPTIRKTGGYRAPKTRKAVAGGLTLEQQETIKALHRELVKAVPKEAQGKLAITLWSSIKSKFGVSYKDVPPEHYAEILSLMSRVAVDFEPPALPKPAYIVSMDFDTRQNGEWRIDIRGGRVQRLAVIYASDAGDPFAPGRQP